MKSHLPGSNKGFMLIELIVVIAIISALSSVAISNFAASQEKALAINCQSNRRNIEMSEQTYYLENDNPGLTIDPLYSCPSGGVYVWLISDPASPEYPKIGCSVHYAYVEPSTDTTESSDSSEATPTPTPEPPEDTKTPDQLIDQLVTTVNSMDIPKRSVKNNLTNKLNNAKKQIEKDKTKNAINKLNSFIDKVRKETGKNIQEPDATILISQAETIINSV